MTSKNKGSTATEADAPLVQDNLEELLAGMRRDLRPAGPAQPDLAGQRCGLIAIVGKPAEQVAQ